MNKRTRPGFTLIELLVVIALIAILMAIVVSAVGKVTMTSSQGQSMTRMQAIGRALQVYRDDWGDVPPYNPGLLDLDGDSNPDPAGPGLWALVLLDYLSDYRYLHDPGSSNEVPWITDSGGTKINVYPGDPLTMEAAHNAYYGAISLPGGELTQREEWLVYNLLARPEDHNMPGTPPTDFGDYVSYDDETGDNWCSWMMQDPYSGEWKYLPVRATAPVGAGGNTFAAGDPLQPLYYHRQLSHVWTDQDSPSYLPASDTVVTWSSLYRRNDRREVGGRGEWGWDLVLFADGHVDSVPGPAADAATDPLEARATVRPGPR